MSDNTWRAAFVHPQHPWRDFEQDLPHREIPPASIRRPSSLAGMPAFDIYLLSDSEPWPAGSTFTYTQTVVGAMRDHRPPEFCLDLEESEAVIDTALETGTQTAVTAVLPAV